MRGRTLLLVAAFSTQAIASDPEGAEKLYRTGREAVARGDWSTACQKFRASYALAESDSTIVYISDCDAREGKVADAAANLRELIERLSRSDAKDPLIPEAKKRLALVEKRVPKLLVRLAPGAPKGTRVTRDGVELKAGALGEALPVNIGEHAIVVSAPGRKEKAWTVQAGEGKAETIEVDVGDVAEGPAEQVRAGAPSTESGARYDRPPSTSRRTIGYVVGGVGVVGLGVAVFTGLSLRSKKDVMDAAHCDSTTKICSGAGMNDGAGAAEATKAASSGQSLQPFFYGGLVLGALGLVAGGYLLVSGDGETTTAVRVTPNRVSLEGSF